MIISNKRKLILSVLILFGSNPTVLSVGPAAPQNQQPNPDADQPNGDTVFDRVTQVIQNHLNRANVNFDINQWAQNNNINLQQASQHFSDALNDFADILTDDEVKNLIARFASVGIDSGFIALQNTFDGNNPHGQQAINSFFDSFGRAISHTLHNDGAARQALNDIREQFARDGNFSELMGEITTSINREALEPIWWVFKKNLVHVGLITAASCFAWYTAKILPKEIMKYLKKPKLIIEYSKHGVWQRGKEFLKYSVWGSTRPNLASDMVFADDLQERLDNIVHATKNIHTKINQGYTNVKYRNLLLYGPPGTGKTMFAKKLARMSGMDYAIMSGSSFAKFEKGEGIKELDHLFKWANNSKGLLIFIDEAESFLGERTNMKSNDQMYQILNQFLNYTGERSNKFMLVFATNHKDDIDSAMHRRIDDAIEIGLPMLDQRTKVLKLYRDKILLDVSQNGQPFVDEARKHLSDSRVVEIARQTEGLSNGDLEGIINSIKTDADITDTGLVSLKVIDQSVKHALEKQTAFKAAQLNRSKQPIAAPAA